MSRALTLEDIDRLGELLARLPEPFVPMEPDMLDGYLTAIALLKNPPQIEQWIGLVYDLEGRSRARLPKESEQAELRSLILARGAEIEEQIISQKPIDPIIFEDDDEGDEADDPYAALRPFADGFALACENWPELMKSTSKAVQAALVGVLRYESEEKSADAEKDESESPKKMRDDADTTADVVDNGAETAAESDAEGAEDDVLESIEEDVAFANLDEALADLTACVQEIAEVTRGADIERAALSAAHRSAPRRHGGKRR